MTDRPDSAGTVRFYSGRQVALLTRHGKERVIAPVLGSALGCGVEHVSGYDTDQLGTFTREIPRVGTQIEAARSKARIGMDLSGLALGVASEGSFGPDPVVGIFPWNVEMLVWIDDALGIEVTGVAAGKTNFAHRLATSWEEAEVFARDTGFPGHGLVVRPQGELDPRIRKGLDDWPALRAAFQWACDQADNHSAFLETDVRAHLNPTRMEMIRLAAVDLAARLNTLCPACGLPGYWLVERVAGLPCADCGAPTGETCAGIHACLKCTQRERRERQDQMHADPARCENCNP